MQFKNQFFDLFKQLLKTINAIIINNNPPYILPIIINVVPDNYSYLSF